MSAPSPGVSAMAVGAAVTVGGSLLPWVRSGGNRRNSYDVFAMVDRVGFAPDGPAATALRWWPLVPLLAVLGVVLAWWGWRRSGAAVGALGAIYAGGVAVAVATAPVAGTIAVEPGAVVTAAGAAVLFAGAVVTFALAIAPTGLVRSSRPATPPDGRS